MPGAASDAERPVDACFSADVETDGPIPGPFSMLSFALVLAGTFDGHTFTRPARYDRHFYRANSSRSPTPSTRVPPR